MCVVGSRGASVPKIKTNKATKKGGDNACCWEFAKVRGQKEKMGRKMKCGKKEMQWTWLVVAVAQGQRKKGNERKGESGSDGSVPRSEEKNTIGDGGSTAL